MPLYGTCAPQRPDARRRQRQAVGVRLGLVQHVLEVLAREFRAAHQVHRRVHHGSHRRQVLQRVVQGFHDVWRQRDRADGGKSQGVFIVGAGHGVHDDHAAGADAVLNDDGPAELCGQLLR
ncbi:hypothetical protein G6F24_016731 [Rhizopus arrhizus]|nr:hypothetical protein G6F24_016731 [Rhizopus arrhizus]